MARIPTGEPGGALGGVVARPGGGVGVDPRAFGVGIAQAAERVAGAGVQQLQAEEAAAAAEERRRLAIEEQERRQREREAKRVAAITATARVVNDLGDLEDDIAGGLADGRYGKEGVGELWQSRAGEIVKGGLEGVDPENRPIVEAQLLDNMGRSKRQIGRMVDARNRQDVNQGTAAHLEEMQRYAARGSAEADEAIRNVEAFIPSVAGQAGIDAQRTVQAFRESVRFRQAGDMVMADPAGAVKQLRDPQKFPELDPDKRAVLIARGETELERRQRRAEIEAERLARVQERTFQGAMSIFEAGRTFTTDYAAQLTQTLRGSPYEGALREMIASGPQNVATATKPIPQQRAELDAIRAAVNAQGADPQRLKELDRREKVLRAAEGDAKTDPLGAVLDRGLVPELPPLNVMNLQGLPQALAARQQAAQVASQWAGRPVSPLRQQEAEQLAAALTPMPPEQKAPVLAAIGAALGDREQIAAVARQIDDKDKLLATAMMYANTRTTQGRHVSEIILRGQQAQRDGRVKEDRAKETGWRAAIAEEIGNAYPNEELRARMVDAAYAVQVGLAAEGDPDVRRAVRMATGGVMTQADDSKVPLPYGWTERELRDGLRSYPANRLPAELRAGPATLTREQLMEQLPNALLVHAGQGRYAIRAGAGFVTDPTGRRVVLDFSGNDR